MNKPDGRTKSERMVRLLRAATTGAVDSGLGGQLIEDEQFLGDTITLQGRRLANFGLCSYLGLGTDERVIEGAIDATRRFGTSYSSSIAYSALGLYADLSERLSLMFDAEVVLAGTTTLGHLAALPVLVRPGALALVDAQVHASVSATLPTLLTSGVDVLPVRHSDVERLERYLQREGDGRDVWYLTDGIFSMHGDSAPAERLMELLNRYTNLHIYCDDAHGFGWDGKNGMGNFLKRSGWHDRLVVSAGMAKSFGTVGGIVATQNEDFIAWIREAGSPLVFGGPIPPPMLGASIAAADIHLSPDHLVLQSELDKRIRFVNDFSVEIGLPLLVREHNPLWFMKVGAFQDTFALATRMKQEGFYLNPAVFPAVPRGQGGIRFTVTNYNSPEQIEGMLVRLNTIRLEMFGETEFEVDLATSDRPKAGTQPVPTPESET